MGNMQPTRKHIKKHHHSKKRGGGEGDGDGYLAEALTGSEESKEGIFSNLGEKLSGSLNNLENKLQNIKTTGTNTASTAFQNLKESTKDNLSAVLAKANDLVEPAEQLGGKKRNRTRKLKSRRKHKHKRARKSVRKA
jgi:hypothetical protein